MEMYKQASKNQIRFTTSKGVLSTEQLWNLELTDLDKLAVSLDTELEKSTTKSFLTPKTDENKKIKLKLDIVLDVLNTLVQEQTDLATAQDTRKHNAKIDRLIAAKQDATLENMSLEELEKLRK